MKSLKKRTIQSSIYVLSGHILSQLIRLFGNLILTRLLVPEMFGVMSIVLVLMMGIHMFTDVGLHQNIVQSKKGEDQDYINSAWTVQILRGFLLFIISVLLSLSLIYLNDNNYIPSGTVYSDPDLPLLLLFISTTAIISGFNSINLLLLSRKLFMAKSVIIDLVSQTIGLVIMLLAAFIYRDIWVLVLGAIISALIKMIMSHSRLLGPQNKLSWNSDHINEIYHFGKWIFISSILGFLMAQGDRLLLGLWESPKTLGIYSIAFTLAIALKELLKKISSSVFYSALSEVERDNPDMLKTIYYKIRLRIDFSVMLVSGFLFSCGEYIITFLYDDRYHDAGWMFEVLSLSNIFVGYSLAGMFLLAKGDSKNNMYTIMITTIFLYISVPYAYYNYGLEMALYAISLNYMVCIPYSWYMMKKYNVFDIVKEVIMLPLLPISYFFGELLMHMFFINS